MKYIRKNKSSFKIIKGQKTYAKTSNLDDIKLIRDILVNIDFNLDKISDYYKIGDYYYILAVIDEQVHLLAKYKKLPSEDKITQLRKKRQRNPNNSKYGLNIYNEFGVFIIRKQIFSDTYIFGYYDNLEDAEFVRNFLLDNEWNVDKFSKFQFDPESGKYFYTEVIDGVVWIIDSNKTGDFTDSYKNFIKKSFENKYHVSSYPQLNYFNLDDSLYELIRGENWVLDSLVSDKSTSDDVILNLTPWQKIIWDNTSDSFTFEDVKSKTKMYRPKDEKLNKILDELIDLGILEKQDNTFVKIF